MAEYRTDPRSDADALEEREWIESLDYVIKHGGNDRVCELLRALQRRAAEFGIQLPYAANTPYPTSTTISDRPASRRGSSPAPRPTQAEQSIW